MARRFGKASSYEDWMDPIVVSNTLELLDKEIPRFKDKITSLHLCFTSDPFMYKYDEIRDLSLNVIKKFNDNDIKCSILTKGILPESMADFSKDNEYGITLISLDETFRKKMEPNSALYVDRIKALKALHDRDCKTWVSIEPYPTPNIIKQDFTQILNAIGFVDKIIFGRLNYNKDVAAYELKNSFYNKLTEQVIKFCSKNNIPYHIKKGTVRQLA
jgi:DNA repair photolyase